MRVRDRVPAAILVVLGAAALVFNMAQVVDPAEPFIGMVFGSFAAAMGAVVLLGGLWLPETDLPVVEHWRILASVGLGVGVTAVWFVLFVGYETAWGVELFEVGFVLSAVLSLGAGTWFLVGLYHSRRTQAERLLRERADELEREREKLDVLNRVLRHNVLNGVAVIQGHVVEAQDDVDPGTRASLETAGDWCTKVTDLVQEVRQILLTMTEDGAEPEVVDLREMLEEEVEKVQKESPHADIQLEGPAGDDWLATGDDLLQPVIANILRNAVEHSDRKEPHVSVSVEEGKDSIHLRVSDDGPGMDETMKEHVLERQAYALDEHGTGLGLFLADRAVSEYGGVLRVQDNEPRGTVVTLELPWPGSPEVAHA